MVQSDNAWLTEDTMRILIATDIHLGYKENDAIQGEDSFIAFEEVLSLAVQYDVDFILLGGDLFHHSKPSLSCMHKCTQLIRKYCIGDKPISIEVLSDQLQNFSRTINYEDPNLNVSFPILSIHGNHDDPVGQNSVSSLDILSTTGLVNYFGKWTDYTKVQITPVLIQKGETKLSLYGLSHLKDQRLARLFGEKKVEMDRLENDSDWFNILVLHQNRADRGPNNYISENVLPKFLDLVIWGHEHDSQVFPINNTKREEDSFIVIQPGSTVATSLASGEALQKHCALLQLHKKEYIVTPLPLKTVRPFIFKTIVLSEENLDEVEVNENEKVQSFLKIKVNEAITEAEKLRSGDPRQPNLPFIRLSVFYETDAQDFNRARFGQNFTGMVANPNELLIMKREKKIRDRKEHAMFEDDTAHVEVTSEVTDVETLLQAYYEVQPPEKQLSVLSVRAVTEAVKDFTIKRDDDVFRKVLDAHRRRCVESLLESTAETEEEINDRMRMCKEALDEADADQLKSLIDAASAKEEAKRKDEKQLVVLLKRESIIVSSDEESSPTVRGRGRGRGARGRGRGRARGKTSPQAPPAPAPAPERRTPKRSAAQKSSTWLQSLTSNRSLRSRKDSSEIEISD